MKFKYDITMTTTALVTTILIITLGVYDLVCVLLDRGASLSVSRFLVNIGFEAPMVVFAFGFTCGHIFGYMKIVKPRDLENNADDARKKP